MGQNIAQNCTTARVVVTMQYWTAVSPQKKICKRSFMRKVEIAVASLKKGKSARGDNIPAELVHADGETMIDVLKEICNRIWRTGERPVSVQFVIMSICNQVNSYHGEALRQGYKCNQMNGSMREWLGVRQGCLLSPLLFNISLERIMSDALKGHDGMVSIGGINITNLRFDDDIDPLAEEEQQLEALVESLDKPAQDMRWRLVRRRPNR